jgi:hypothetical protein
METVIDLNEYVFAILFKINNGNVNQRLKRSREVDLSFCLINQNKACVWNFLIFFTD